MFKNKLNIENELKQKKIMKMMMMKEEKKKKELIDFKAYIQSKR